MEKREQMVPNLYLERSSDNYIRNGEPRALYWASYREKYESIKEQIVSGSQVPVGESVCILANNRLQPHDFDLRRKDRQPVGKMDQPGISAHVHFSDNPHEVCGAIMDRDLKRQDAVYIASVNETVNAGWKPIFAPTPNQPLHVRLVPTELVGSDPEQPAMKLRRGVVEVFNKKKIRRSTFRE